MTAPDNKMRGLLWYLAQNVLETEAFKYHFQGTMTYGFTRLELAYNEHVHNADLADATLTLTLDDNQPDRLGISLSLGDFVVISPVRADGSPLMLTVPELVHTLTHLTEMRPDLPLGVTAAIPDMAAVHTRLAKIQPLLAALAQLLLAARGAGVVDWEDV